MLNQRLWTVAHGRFERLYGVEKAALLRGLLAEIYSDEFAAAFTAESRQPLRPRHRRPGETAARGSSHH